MKKICSLFSLTLLASTCHAQFAFQIIAKPTIPSGQRAPGVNERAAVTIRNVGTSIPTPIILVDQPYAMISAQENSTLYALGFWGGMAPYSYSFEVINNSTAMPDNRLSVQSARTSPLTDGYIFMANQDVSFRLDYWGSSPNTLGNASYTLYLRIYSTACSMGLGVGVSSQCVIYQLPVTQTNITWTLGAATPVPGSVYPMINNRPYNLPAPATLPSSTFPYCDSWGVCQ